MHLCGICSFFLFLSQYSFFALYTSLNIIWQGNFFWVSSIWCPVCILYLHFFKLENFSSMVLLKIFSGPLNWYSSFFSVTIILRFGIFYSLLDFWHVLYHKNFRYNILLNLHIHFILSCLQSWRSFLLSLIFCWWNILL